jgi:hypothetical protein
MYVICILCFSVDTLTTIVYVTPRVSNLYDYVNYMFKRPKFCVVWTIKLSKKFFRINWNLFRPHSQNIKCSS